MVDTARKVGLTSISCITITIGVARSAGGYTPPVNTAGAAMGVCACLPTITTMGRVGESLYFAPRGIIVITVRILT